MSSADRGWVDVLTPENYEQSCRLRSWAGFFGAAWVERESEQFVAWCPTGPGGTRPSYFDTLTDALEYANRPRSPHFTVVVNES